MFPDQQGAISRLPERDRELLSNLAAPTDEAGLRALVAAVQSHLEDAEAARAGNDLLDLPLARRIAHALLALLADYDALPGPEARALAVGAARFFVEKEDSEPDLGSALGFDDDARVLNAVLGFIGRLDLKVEF